jgi:hypothetical protein
LRNRVATQSLSGGLHRGLPDMRAEANISQGRIDCEG